MPNEIVLSSNTGHDFLTWIKASLLKNAPPTNRKKALVYTVPEGLFLVSPAIFKCYDAENWRYTQKRFERLRVHRPNVDGSIHTYFVNGKHKKPDRLSGYLISYSNMFDIEQLEPDRCLKAS